MHDVSNVHSFYDCVAFHYPSILHLYHMVWMDKTGSNGLMDNIGSFIHLSVDTSWLLWINAAMIMGLQYLLPIPVGSGGSYGHVVYTFSVQISSVQSLSRVRLFATPWIAACQASLSITKSRSLLRCIPIKSVMSSSHLILCRPLLLLLPIPPSFRVFSNESTLRMRWPKYWSFSFSISPSSEHPGLISFRSLPLEGVYL